jgi:hypothetical protein
MNKLFFSFLMILIICVNFSQAVTVVNSRYSSSLSAGSSDSFTMTMKPDIPSEQGIMLTTGMDTGNCSDWVTLDKTGIKLVSAGTPVKASISVPSDATNGLHRCYAQFTAPQVGMVSSQIAVPFTIVVTGGKQPTIAPTIAQVTSAAPTMKAPIEERAVVAVEPQPASGPAPALPYLWIVGGILAMAFIITMIYDWRRKL